MFRPATELRILFSTHQVQPQWIVTDQVTSLGPQWREKHTSSTGRMLQYHVAGACKCVSERFITPYAVSTNAVLAKMRFAYLHPREREDLRI